MGIRSIQVGDMVVHNNGGSSINTRYHEVLAVHNHLAMIKSVTPNSKGESGAIQLMRLDRLIPHVGVG